nr:hypothetical protein [Pseudopedobacter sp.]
MNQHEFKNEDYLDPKYWILGIFYFNKNDKRIFPPKRIKQMGWTVNFANPTSVFALIAVLAIIYIIANYIKSL